LMADSAAAGTPPCANLERAQVPLYFVKRQWQAPEASVQLTCRKDHATKVYVRPNETQATPTYISAPTDRIVQATSAQLIRTCTRKLAQKKEKN
jgi:hypothetical protein